MICPYCWQDLPALAEPERAKNWNKVNIKGVKYTAVELGSIRGRYVRESRENGRAVFDPCSPIPLLFVERID
jgi:hypothetical protein